LNTQLGHTGFDPQPIVHRLILWTAILLALLSAAGCGTMSVAARNAWAAAGTTGASVSPNLDLEQTYYLGSFDPQGQLPPAVYRIRVRGQSSVLNQTRFASSWVPAEVVDALTGSISLNLKSGSAEVTKAETSSALDAGRGLWMFGPEGFREAPRNHRLVIVMGASPETVEQAFASALGTVAMVRAGQPAVGLESEIFAALLTLANEREQLRAISLNP
jgi:hypothetical protein